MSEEQFPDQIRETIRPELLAEAERRDELAATVADLHNQVAMLEESIKAVETFHKDLTNITERLNQLPRQLDSNLYVAICAAATINLFFAFIILW